MRFTKRLMGCFVLVIGIGLLFSSCATHTLTVPKPAPEGSFDEWLLFYRDQFKGYGNSTLPPSGNAPEVARQAYSQARVEWQNKEATSYFVWWLVSGLIIGGIGYIMIARNLDF